MENALHPYSQLIKAETRLTEAKAEIARLQAQGATRRQLAYLRGGLEYYFGARKAILNRLR